MMNFDWILFFGVCDVVAAVTGWAVIELSVYVVKLILA